MHSNVTGCRPRPPMAVVCRLMLLKRSNQIVWVTSEWKQPVTTHSMKHHNVGLSCLLSQHLNPFCSLLERVGQDGPRAKNFFFKKFNDSKTPSQSVNVKGKGLTCKRPPSCTLSKRSPRSSRLPETVHGNPEGGWRYVPKVHWLLWTLWNSQVVFHQHSLNELGPISRRRYRQECHSGFSAVSRG